MEFKIATRPEAEPQYFQTGVKILPIEINHSKTPVFCYNYTSIDNSSSCFNYDGLTSKEYVTYFEAAKRMSRLPLFELLEDGGKPYHFHTINGKNLDSIDVRIRRLLNIDHSVPKEDLPAIGQFALYTDVIEEDKKIQTKAPRVIFAIGNNGVLNILFIDLYHKIYPKNPKEVYKKKQDNIALRKIIGKFKK